MPSYIAEVAENEKKGFEIIALKAKSFADKNITYTLSVQGQGKGTFDIGHSSGIVTLAKELDFEDLRQPHIYQVLVTATEDSEGFSTSVELRIHVLDVNDNTPTFGSDYYEANIDESTEIGMSILKVEASDADSGQNSDIVYFVSDEHFDADKNGKISYIKRLNTTSEDAFHEFQVSATDNG